MKSFITYFDLMGYKSFIEKNDFQYVEKRVLRILHNAEMALAQFKITPTNRGYTPDLAQSSIMCLNFSDTIIFWTKDDSFESFKELLKVSFEFNHLSNCGIFPVRGAMVFGELGYIPFDLNTKNDSSYRVNSLWGNGLVDAHLKAESLDLAGCVINNSVVDQIKKFSEATNEIKKLAILYDVPCKNQQKVKEPEFMLKFSSSEKLNESAFYNRAKQILEAFKNDNKDFNQRAGELYQNTIKFLEMQRGGEEDIIG